MLFRTPVKFKQGLFDEDFFDKPIDVRFEDTCLMASAKIKEYLNLRYGDYMELPPEEKRSTSQHAEFFETNNRLENTKEELNFKKLIEF